MQHFRQLASEENPKMQMILPMVEIVGLLRRAQVICCEKLRSH